METVHEPQADAPPEAAHVGEDTLSVLDVVVQSLGFIGPVFPAAFLLPSVAGLGFTGKVAGVASPLALIVDTERSRRDRARRG